jgi:hypothetical protein
MISALPAFVLGGFVVGALGRLGINQVSSFMLVMPVLISAWYYFTGWLFDRWIRKRSQPSRLSPDERLSRTIFPPLPQLPNRRE